MITTELTARQQAIIGLLWDSMKRDPEHKDRVRTSWGTKTKLGLALCVERIFEEHPAGKESQANG